MASDVEGSEAELIGFPEPAMAEVLRGLLPSTIVEQYGTAQEHKVQVHPFVTVHTVDNGVHRGQVVSVSDDGYLVVIEHDQTRWTVSVPYVVTVEETRR